MRTALILTVLLAATTAHAQWEIQTAPTTADLRGIHALGNGIAWASGSDGTVLRTTDDGKDWQRCATPPDADHLDFRGVQAFDASTAIVMSSGKGTLSRLYKTSDACQTWTLVFTNPDQDGFWDALSFEPPNPHFLRDHTRRGLIVGDPVRDHFSAFISSDLGNTWTPIGKDFSRSTPRARRGETLFAASNSSADAVGDAGNACFVTGGTGGPRFFHLVGGGLVLDWWMTLPSFEETNLGFPHRTASEGAFSVARREVDQVTFDFMAVGGDYLKPDQQGSSVFLPAPSYSFFIRHQEQIYPQTPPHGFRSAVAYDASTKTWITVGPNGTDISTDDGRNWRALRPDPALGEAPDADEHWNALSLPFVVGPMGELESCGRMRCMRRLGEQARG
jgi:hypothetical protein